MATVSTAHLHQAGINLGNTTDRNDVATSMFLEPSTDLLPESVQLQLTELDIQFREGDLTDKGYHKRRSLVLIPYLIPYTHPKDVIEKKDETIIEPEVEYLPQPVVEELRLLQEELQNEEITEKGFNKRRTTILAPYMLREPAKHELPSIVQQEYYHLELEYKEGDLTDKGFKKKKLKLLKPYLVCVNPTTYTNPRKNISKSGSEETLDTVVMGIQSEMPDGKKLFKCGVCGEVFKQAHSFSGHCRIHRGERVKNFKCKICSASYTTRAHLKFHMYKHSGDFPFTCSHCGKGFAGRSQHKSHESRHTGDSPYPCPLCGAKFWKKDQSELHIKHTCPNKDSNIPSPAPDLAEKIPWTPSAMEEHTDNHKVEWSPMVSDRYTVSGNDQYSVSGDDQYTVSENNRYTGSENNQYTVSGNNQYTVSGNNQFTESLKTDTQNTQQSFRTEEVNHQMHMQDLPHENLSTRADLNVVTSLISTDYELTTPVYQVGNSLDTKPVISLPNNLSQSFHTEGISHEMHMEDLSHINISTITDLTDVTSPISISTDVYTRELTTPILQVGNSLDHNVRLNLDSRLFKDV